MEENENVSNLSNSSNDKKSLESNKAIREDTEKEELVKSEELLKLYAELSEMEPELKEEIARLSKAISSVKAELRKVIIGQDKIIDALLVSLIVGGNVLLEGVPGIAKTLIAKMLAKTIHAQFTRIQFTPDLMPTDIIGTMVFNMQQSTFEFKPGPIFSNIILIDEVNRAPAKTQAALIEVMEEKQVTVEGKTYEMSQPFFVIATQNPVEQEGTYKLPEAQLDRFIFRLKMQYPNLEDEQSILSRFSEDFDNKVANEVEAVLDPEEILKARKIVEGVYIKPDLLDYIAKIVVSTRDTGDLYLGASPRASLSILKASKAYALLNGRNFVTPDDIKQVTVEVLNHRIILSHEREMEGLEVEEVIEQLVEDIEIPR